MRGATVWAPLAAIALLAACDATDPGVKAISDAGAGGTSRADAPLGSATGDGGSGAAVDVPRPPSADATAMMPPQRGDAACAMQSVQAERRPLDLYLMVDSSGSMLQRTAAGQTKWDAVKAAIAGFLNDPQSAGLGVGLQFFPQIRPGVPESCTADAACGNFGPCQRVRTCSGATMVTNCESDAQCPRNQRCVLVGLCTLTPQACLPIGGTCGAGPLGTPLGNRCVELEGYCGGRDLCDAPAYQTPAVAIADLPGAAGALAMSLNAREPDGNTPTAPALRGAIDQARARQQAMPGRRTAVVLATDGLPTECAPTDIPGISAVAQMGAAAAPGVSTFVIGVFAPPEQQVATMNLNALAQAGGTGRAFVINTDQNVTQAFQAALNQIRTTALACEYKIPAAMAGAGAIDFGKVNVQFTSGAGQSTTIGNVRDRAACHPMLGGWYYDVNPAAGKPTTIVACEQTCATLRGDPRGRVDIVLGCQTVVID